MIAPTLFPIIRRRRVPLTNTENPARLEVKPTAKAETPEVVAEPADLKLVVQEQAELPQTEAKTDGTPTNTTPPDSIPTGTGNHKKGRK